MANKDQVGQWSVPIDFNNVLVHASLLPTGKVLYWGRRENPKGPVDDNTMNEQKTKAFVWDPDMFFWDPTIRMSRAKPNDNKPGLSQATANVPLDWTNKSDNQVNIFCGGHCFLPDGNLLIVGGHFRDGRGIDQACLYNPWTNTFTPRTPMNGGRWYPTALALPDGRVMVMSGALKDKGAYQPNNISQIWTLDPAQPWAEVMDSEPAGPQRPGGLALYPRLHLSPQGRIFMAGANPGSWFLDVKDPKGADIKTKIQNNGKAKDVIGRWEDAKTARQLGFRDYAPSVMYDKGLIMYIGGGLEQGGPTNQVEFIDLNVPQPKWSIGPSMSRLRRQFNATVLPDGTVLVTGGTRGPEFNSLDEFAVHQAELFDPYEKDPSTGLLGRWTDMAPETFDRCYHGTALLLPDGRVLSAGSGEWPPARPQDCLTLGQLFEPPYLHKPDPRPVIANAPLTTTYGADITLTLGTTIPIKQISWLRLGSVTHCCNMTQSFLWLKDIKQSGTSLTVKAPENANISPPGHYMLFVLTDKRIPSTGKIIQILPSKPLIKRIMLPSSLTSSSLPARTTPAPPTPNIQPSTTEHNHNLITSKGHHPPVTIGITPACPYGLGPCWAGAYDALARISDIDAVCPVAHQEDATAHVYLTDDILPDMDKWRGEFARSVNASYVIRGIELTLSGRVGWKESEGEEGERVMMLAGTETRRELVLGSFGEGSQIRWDNEAGGLRGVEEKEVGAYKRLEGELDRRGDGGLKGVEVKVTGTLQKHGDGRFSLDVREFEVLDRGSG